MDDDEIHRLLCAIEPPKDLGMPVPPNMTAIPAAAVADAGADLEEVEAWVKQRRGWAKRIPPHFLPPDASQDRDALVLLVPDRELEGAAPAAGAAPRTAAPAAGGVAPRTPAPAAAGAPRHSGPPAIFEGADLVAFVPTTNLTQVKAFYGTMLGLPLSGESPIAVNFDANGTTLRCVLVERFKPYPFTLVGWNVDDIAATVTELTARGIAFERFDGIDHDPIGVWHTPGGAQVAWFKDPFGNTLSMTQF